MSTSADDMLDVGQPALVPENVLRGLPEAGCRNAPGANASHIRQRSA
jgi:hypothetical protein